MDFYSNCSNKLTSFNFLCGRLAHRAHTHGLVIIMSFSVVPLQPCVEIYYDYVPRKVLGLWNSCGTALQHIVPSTKVLLPVLCMCLCLCD